MNHIKWHKHFSKLHSKNLKINFNFQPLKKCLFSSFVAQNTNIVPCAKQGEEGRVNDLGLLSQWSASLEPFWAICHQLLFPVGHILHSEATSSCSNHWMRERQLTHTITRFTENIWWECPRPIMPGSPWWIGNRLAISTPGDFCNFSKLSLSLVDSIITNFLLSSHPNNLTSLSSGSWAELWTYRSESVALLRSKLLNPFPKQSCVCLNTFIMRY